MSYPYDYNPWDDSPAAQPAEGAGLYAAGYSTGQAYAGDQAQQAQGNMGPEYPQQVEELQPEEKEPEKQEQSRLGRLLRQHVPACGPVLDTLSKINLPFIDALFQHVNRDLLISKMFYFFFYSAFGSLFPLMGVYFKQQGMNPGQVGILTGVRPLIEIFSAPFWHSIADRFNKSKALLLFSLLSWIVFTYSLAHIRPPASGCIAFNDTDYVIYTPYSANDLSNYEINGEPMGVDSATGNEYMDSRNFQESAPESGRGAEAARSKRKRRRRRRRRQTDTWDEVRRRFVYNVGGASADSYAAQDNELELDLENDFEDEPLAGGGGHSLQRVDGLSGAKSAAATDISSHLGRENNIDNNLSAGSGELQQLPSKSSRYRRAAEGRMKMKKGNKQEEEEEEDGGEEGESDGPGEKELASSTGGGDEEKVREASSGEKEEAAEEEGDDQEGESRQPAAEAADNADNKKSRGTVKHNQQQAPATLASAPPSTTQQPAGEPNQGGSGGSVNKTKRIYKQRHKTPPNHIVGMSPITIQYAVNYNPEKHSQSVTPMFSTIVYKLDDIKEVFFLLLLLISLGEFFSAPALTLADSVTLSYLGDNTDLYGRQRMFGSLSWAITLLLVGMALDNSTSIADHPCGPHLRERSYTVCFIIFSLLMACAFFTATQFRFNNSSTHGGGNRAGASQTMLASTTDSKTVVTTTVDGATANIDELYASTQPRSIFNTAPPVNAPPPSAQHSEKKFEFLDNWKSAVFAQRTRELPQWLSVFCQFKNTLHLMYLFITWFLGCGVGLVFTFLFWHLQEVGGTPTLFGICSVINHVSEILAYFFSLKFIKRFGHTKVLSVGLGCNFIRFLYVAFLTNPYYALPFELVQGITHSTCFAVCCSYMSRASKSELKNSTQGVMQGLYHGIGRACGALLGGYMINWIGSRATFCIYGLLSGCVLAGFLQVRKRVGPKEPEGAEVKADEGAEALGGLGAPQGVPSAIDYQW